MIGPASWDLWRCCVTYSPGFKGAGLYHFLMDDFRVWIPGQPQPKARPRFRVVNGRAMAYTPKNTADYEQLIAEQIRKAYPSFRQTEKPVRLDMEFHVAPAKTNMKLFRYHSSPTCTSMPEGDWRVGPAVFNELWTPCKKCKPSAIAYFVPQHPKGKPDLDNYEKAVMDGLQKSEVVKDDSQVVQKVSSKFFSPTPGVLLHMSFVEGL